MLKLAIAGNEAVLREAPDFQPAAISRVLAPAGRLAPTVITMALFVKATVGAVVSCPVSNGPEVTMLEK